MDKIKIQKIIKFYGLEENKRYYLGDILTVRFKKIEYMFNKSIGVWATLRNDGNDYYYLHTNTGMKILLFDLEKGYNKSRFNLPSITFTKKWNDKLFYYTHWKDNDIINYAWFDEYGYDGIRFILSTLYPFEPLEPRQMNIFDDMGVKYEG